MLDVLFSSIFLSRTYTTFTSQNLPITLLIKTLCPLSQSHVFCILLLGTLNELSKAEWNKLAILLWIVNKLGESLFCASLLLLALSEIIPTLIEHLNRWLLPGLQSSKTKHVVMPWLFMLYKVLVILTHHYEYYYCS